MQGMWVRSLDREDPLEKEMPTTPVFLPGKLSMDRGAWLATAHRVAKSWIRLKQLSTAQDKDNLIYKAEI